MLGVLLRSGDTAVGEVPVLTTYRGKVDKRSSGKHTESQREVTAKVKSGVGRREREKGLQGVNMHPPLWTKSSAWLLRSEMQRMLRMQGLLRMQGVQRMTTVPAGPEAKALPDPGKRL